MADHVEEPLSNPQTDVDHPLPTIAAAFCVKFDARKGYIIAWQRSEHDIQLDGVIEYKSLPSGLHNVEEDIVYFIHEDYAGISAFLNRPDAQAERSARMLAVGVLVPLDHGRLGKSWLHAGPLRTLAEQQIQDSEGFTALEKYWEEHKAKDDIDDDANDQKHPMSTAVHVKDGLRLNTESNGHPRARRISTTSMSPAHDQTLPPHHPALSLPKFLELLGPLVFPLLRAALLRKRILIMTEAPVQEACNFVYILSILSSIPASVAPTLAIEMFPNIRLRPLFNVGVHDIPELLRLSRPGSAALDEEQGWIACTTDDVIAAKPELFDLLVLLPSSDTLCSNPRSHGKVVLSSPDLYRTFPKQGLRATQRDARQSRRLRSEVATLSSAAENLYQSDTVQSSESASMHSAAVSAMSDRSLVQPASWPLIAYTSLVWWASAGEKRLGLLEEEEVEAAQDLRLLYSDREEPSSKEIAIVTYFHHLTTVIFNVVHNAIASTDHEEFEDDTPSIELDSTSDETAVEISTASLEPIADNPNEEQEPLLPSQRSVDEGYEPEDVEITEDDMKAMALDIWNTDDRAFIEDLVAAWYDRRVKIRGGTIECCGLRIV